MMMRWATARVIVTHAAASAVAVAAMTMVAAAACLVLLLAAVASGGVDSSSASPAVALVALAAGIASVPLVFLPATLLAEAIGVRARLRLWWQLPIGAGVIFSAATVILFFAAALGVLPAPDAATTVSAAAPALIGTAIISTLVLAAPFSVYWCALQCTDWLLGTSARWLGAVWPSRFGALARPVDPPARPWRGAGRFRIREHFTYAEGLSTMLVLSGEIVDGSIRHGMRACAADGSRTLTATIRSVERAGQAEYGPPAVGLLLSIRESDLGTWRSAARAGRIIGIVE